MLLDVAFISKAVLIYLRYQKIFKHVSKCKPILILCQCLASCADGLIESSVCGTL